MKMVLGLPPQLASIGYMIIGLLVSNTVLFSFVLIIFFTTKGVLPPIIKAKLRNKTLLVLLKKNKKNIEKR